MVDSRLARAEHLIDLGRHTEAERILGELLAEEPQSARAWTTLARCYDQQNDGHRCRWAAGEALALEPGSEWAHRLRAYGASTLGLRDEAVWHAREAVRINPESYRTHICLAHVLLNTRRSPKRGMLFAAREATAAAGRSVTLAPEVAACHITVGWVAMRRARWQEAIRANERALALEPDNPTALYNLALVRRRRGQMVRSVQGFGRVLALEPDIDRADGNLEEAAFGVVVRFVEMSLWPFFLMCGVGFNEVAGHPHAMTVIRAIVSVLVALGWAVAIRVVTRRLPEPVLAHLRGAPKRHPVYFATAVSGAACVALPVLMGWLPFALRVAAAAGAGSMIVTAWLLLVPASRITMIRRQERRRRSRIPAPAPPNTG
jgi:Tfp pilus assembly protein PilF